MAPANESPLILPEPSSQESPASAGALLPPSTREQLGQALKGLRRKPIKDAIRARRNVDPETFNKAIDMLIADTISPDRELAHTAFKILADYSGEKPVQTVANDDDNPIGPAVIQFNVVPRRD